MFLYMTIVANPNNSDRLKAADAKLKADTQKSNEAVRKTFESRTEAERKENTKKSNAAVKQTFDSFGKVIKESFVVR